MKPDARSLLSSFLTINKIGRAEAAAALGVTRTTLYYWLTGQTVPLEKVKADIETWTDKKVPAAAWPTSDRRKAHKVKPFARAAGS